MQNVHYTSFVISSNFMFGYSYYMMGYSGK